jgi:altronate dehydratase small subunit
MAPRVIVLDPSDNVAVALAALAGDETVTFGQGTVKVVEPIRFGHKIATREIGAGDPVLKYHEVIGIATRDIAPGEHVHVQNVVSSRLPGS